MPEALTESFCERCGTRYEFAAPTELGTVRKTKGLISGLKNYIMSQDALSDAVGDAMRSEEAQLAAQQLDAFHESFNFCIECRQYTCVNCWNDDAGRCRSCVPIAGTDDLLERFEATFQAGHVAHASDNGSAPADLSQDEIQRRLGIDAWPSADLPASDGLGAPEQPLLETSEEAGPEAPPEPAPAQPVLEGEAATGAAWEDDATWELLPAVPAAEPPMPEPGVEEPLVAEEPQVVAEEPLVAEEAPGPVTSTPIVPVSETIVRLSPPEPAAPPAPVSDESMPTAAEVVDDEAMAARRAQLELLGLGDPGEGPVRPEPGKVLPYRSRGAAPTAAEIAAYEQLSPEMSRGFWEASAREVAAAMTQVGVQACGDCGLSLSASARFCRRCGTRQAKSA